MEITGGVAQIETYEWHSVVVGGLPGVVAQLSEPWDVTFGTGELLRKWAAHPDFRLLK